MQRRYYLSIKFRFKSKHAQVYSKKAHDFIYKVYKE